MTTISNTNLFSASYTNIKYFIESISNIDPRSRYKKKYIHASMPNINDKGFNGYPFIVLRSDVEEELKSFDRDTSNKIFRITLQIYSDEATDVDTMSDLIMSNFKDETKLTDFPGREISSSPMNWDLDLNGKKIVYRTIGLIFRKRI